MVRELTVAVILFLISLAIGLFTGQLGWAFTFALLIRIAIQRKEYRKVAKWARKPHRVPANGSEIWFPLAYNPYRALLKERARTKTMATQLREIVSLTQMIPDAVIILSAQGEIEGLNHAAEDLLNLSSSDIGLSLATVVRNPDFIQFIRSGSHDEPLEFVYATDQERTYEARRIETDGERSIMLVRDVTALNRVLTMRQSFVANVSHELRTPLTVVHGYLETILDEEQDAALRLELTQRLDSPIRRMQNLVNDLMLLARLESGPAGPQIQPIKLGQIVRSAATELQPLCSTADQVCLDIKDDEAVIGHESELHSVCVNLISNAIRYSPLGNKITVRVTANDQFVKLAVIDHGYGIAPEHLSRLTERFYRVDLAGARTRGGTGLGLAIVKHVLLRHDSELMIESELGQGSTFSCNFNRASLES
ncbi:MAG: phosphate regulon sensor histidine kinase PhoR [Pseudomonadota bacterium]